MGLFADGGTVIVEGARPVALGEEDVFAVTGYAGLDTASGKVLWTATVTGIHQELPIAAASGYLVTGAPSGTTVTGQVAATGTAAWTLALPRGCGSLRLAGDGPLVVLSYDCGPGVVVERLNPATGKVLWTWRSPVVAGLTSQQLAVTTVSAAGGLVLLSGGLSGTAGATQRFTAALPHPRAWQALLGPTGSGNVILALTAAGHPAWTETGAQQVMFAPTGDELCEEVRTGFDCRTDATGALAVPTQTAYPGGDGSAISGDGYDATADGLIAATEPVTGPGAKTAVNLRVTSVATGKTIAVARLGIRPVNVPGWNVTTTAVAASPLTRGSVLVLVRRIDAKSHPLLALSIPLPNAAQG
jgi:hypothetical protein